MHELLFPTSPAVRRAPLAACLLLALATTPHANGNALAEARTQLQPTTSPSPIDSRRPGGRYERAAAIRTPSRNATTLDVTSCDDDGSPGTLRDAVVNAVSGDTIDLSLLTCSTVSLAAGALVTPVDDLALVGPGAAALSIDARGNDSTFIHAGRGTLSISGLTLVNGRYDSDLRFPLGGCVYSSGNVSLVDSIVSTCEVSGIGYVYGGGIYARGKVTLTNSTISNGSAHSRLYSSSARGGDVFAAGNLTMTRSRLLNGSVHANYDSRASGGAALVVGDLVADYSTIDGNSADPGTGGGIQSLGNATIRSSTFSNNTAASGGALFLGRAFGTTPSASLINATVSGNTATQKVGGIYARVGLTLSNSTIVSNSAYGTDGTIAGGLLVPTGVANTLQSSIIAGNTSAGEPSDLTATDLFNLFGANNLVVVATAAEPPGTIHDDPQLLPLSSNGGPTKTHMPMPTSPVIEAGNNLAELEFDQRGPGFARVVGAASDIGAVEWSDDVIFIDGFE